MKEKRRDNKGRILHTGESQRTDGKYLYKYVDAFGNTKYVYAWRLTPTDPTPKGKREKPSLRELEQQIRRDIEDGIDSTGKKMTLCQLYAKQNAQRGFQVLIQTPKLASNDNRRCHMYAIIATGGKQYKVAEGDIIKVEKLGVEAGETYTFDQVLAVSNDKLVVGEPTVAGATVTASVIGDGKAKKVIVYKYKRKTGYHKKNGHRQQYTAVKIEKINA